MKWFKKIPSDIFSLICFALYYVDRRDTGSQLQHIVDILIPIVLVLMVIKFILSRFVR
ncbi:MAG: hypothetical protein LLG02_17240 [Pelosinus sp.]|nr:hypothetical protein [Pelosinus sp.]